MRSYVLAYKPVVAAQGTAAATWRTYRRRRLGPYFQVPLRESCLPRRLYAGLSGELAGRARDLLARLQRHRRVVLLVLAEFPLLGMICGDHTRRCRSNRIGG